MKIAPFPIVALLSLALLVCCGKPRYAPADAYPIPEADRSQPDSTDSRFGPDNTVPDADSPGDTSPAKPELPSDTLRPVFA